MNPSSGISVKVYNASNHSVDRQHPTNVDEENSNPNLCVHVEQEEGSIESPANKRIITLRRSWQPNGGPITGIKSAESCSSSLDLLCHKDREEDTIILLSSDYSDSSTCDSLQHKTGSYDDSNTNQSFLTDVRDSSSDNTLELLHHDSDTLGRDSKDSMNDTVSIADFLKVLRNMESRSEASSSHTEINDKYLTLDGNHHTTNSVLRSDFMTENTEELLNWSEYNRSPSNTTPKSENNSTEDDETVALFARVSKGDFHLPDSKTIASFLDTPNTQRSFKGKAESIRCLTESLKKANNLQLINKERRLSRLSVGIPSSATSFSHPDPSSNGTMISAPLLERNDSKSTSPLSLTKPSSLRPKTSNQSSYMVTDRDENLATSKYSSAKVNMNNSTEMSVSSYDNSTGSKRKYPSSPQHLAKTSKRLMSSTDTAELDAILALNLSNSSSSVETSLLLSPLSAAETTESHISPSKSDYIMETGVAGAHDPSANSLNGNSNVDFDPQSIPSAICITDKPESSSLSFSNQQLLSKSDHNADLNSMIAMDPSLGNPCCINQSTTSSSCSNCLSQNEYAIIAKINDSLESHLSPVNPSLIIGRIGTPKSILNHSRRGNRLTQSVSVTKKSVVFGSPEYAEYNVGSPSTNLTPRFPKERTNLKVINEASDSSSTRDKSSMYLDSFQSDASFLIHRCNPSYDNDKTIELEHNLTDVLIGIEDSGSPNVTESISELKGSHNKTLRESCSTEVSSAFLSPLVEIPAANESALTSRFSSRSIEQDATIELECDMNEMLLAAGTQTGDDVNVEEKTVELDSTIGQLLNTVGGHWLNSEISAHQPHRLSTMSISREESLSLDFIPRSENQEYLGSLLISNLDDRPPSRRVSLAPKIPLSYLSTSSHDDSSDRSHLMTEDGFSLESSISKSEILDINWQEIVSCTNLLSPDTLVAEDFQDLFLHQLSMILLHTKNPIVFDGLQTFLEDACNTMETYAEADPTDGETIFQRLLQENTMNMVNFQRLFRGYDNSDASLTNQLITLSDLSKLIIAYEMRSWEAKVSEALILAMNGILNEIDVELHEINRRINLADDVDFSLSLLSGQAIKQARRNSIFRRQVSVYQLMIELKIDLKTYNSPMK